jgi:Predicted solute binding protein
MIKRPVIAIFILVLSMLACSRQIATTVPPTPGTTPSPIPTATPVPSTTVTTPSEQWTAVVEHVQVNVRAAPAGSVVGVVRSGDSVVILSCDGSWCQIVEPAGYVWRGCLSDNPKGLGCEAR